MCLHISLHLSCGILFKERDVGFVSFCLHVAPLLQKDEPLTVGLYMEHWLYSEAVFGLERGPVGLWAWLLPGLWALSSLIREGIHIPIRVDS